MCPCPARSALPDSELPTARRRLPLWGRTAPGGLDTQHPVCLPICRRSQDGKALWVPAKYENGLDLGARGRWQLRDWPATPSGRPQWAWVPSLGGSCPGRPRGPQRTSRGEARARGTRRPVRRTEAVASEKRARKDKQGNASPGAIKNTLTFRANTASEIDFLSPFFMCPFVYGAQFRSANNGARVTGSACRAGWRHHGAEAGPRRVGT